MGVFDWPEELNGRAASQWWLGYAVWGGATAKQLLILTPTHNYFVQKPLTIGASLWVVKQWRIHLCTVFVSEWFAGFFRKLIHEDRDSIGDYFVKDFCL